MRPGSGRRPDQEQDQRRRGGQARGTERDPRGPVGEAVCDRALAAPQEQTVDVDQILGPIGQMAVAASVARARIRWAATQASAAQPTCLSSQRRRPTSVRRAASTAIMAR